MAPTCFEAGWSFPQTESWPIHVWSSSLREDSPMQCPIACLHLPYFALSRIEIFLCTVCGRRCSIDFDASCVQSGIVLASTVTCGPDLVYLANDCDSTVLSVGGCTAELM